MGAVNHEDVLGFSMGGSGTKDNQIIKTTAGEMVLNKRQQRNLLSFLNSPPSNGLTVNVTVAGAMDGEDVFRTLSRNRDALGAVLLEGGFSGTRGFGR